MIITVMVNITVMIYEYRRGKQMQSDILIVDSMHTRADIFTSLSVIVALICVKLGFPIIDPVITLIISGFIAYSAFIIIRQESGILCDAVAITDTKKIEAVVIKIKGVKSCHKIRTRGRPDDVYLDLHIQIACGYDNAGFAFAKSYNSKRDNECVPADCRCACAYGTRLGLIQVT